MRRLEGLQWGVTGGEADLRDPRELQWGGLGVRLRRGIQGWGLQSGRPGERLQWGAMGRPGLRLPGGCTGGTRVRDRPPRPLPLPPRPGFETAPCSAPHQDPGSRPVPAKTPGSRPPPTAGARCPHPAAGGAGTRCPCPVRGARSRRRLTARPAATGGGWARRRGRVRAALPAPTPPPPQWCRPRPIVPRAARPTGAHHRPPAEGGGS